MKKWNNFKVKAKVIKRVKNNNTHTRKRNQQKFIRFKRNLKK